MSALRSMLMTLKDVKVPVAWLCKGFEAGSQSVESGAMPHEVCQQVAPQLQAGALSGPSFALEVATAQPTALVAASAHPKVRQLLVDAFHSSSLRVYANEDIVGVEVGGAVKNVLAIATGLCDGLNLGLNARAALIARGFAEMTRFGLARGARAETLAGLSGLGDLVLTCSSANSRNFTLGLGIGRGERAADLLNTRTVAEGAATAPVLVAAARAIGVEMPIAEAVAALLGGAPVAATISALLGRPLKAE